MFAKSRFHCTFALRLASFDSQYVLLYCLLFIVGAAAVVLGQDEPELQPEVFKEEDAEEEGDGGGHQGGRLQVGQDEGPGDLVDEGEGHEEREDEEDVLEERRVRV